MEVDTDTAHEHIFHLMDSLDHFGSEFEWESSLVEGFQYIPVHTDNGMFPARHDTGHWHRTGNTR